MSPGWVAGNVRARAILRRRLGREASRRLAAATSLDGALATLAASAYGHHVRTGTSLAEAQHAVVDTVVWNVRVLAGWLPGRGLTVLRAMAGTLEAANVTGLLHRSAGAAAAAPFRLGSLAVAWPRLATATTPAEIRRVLSASPWGDPLGETPRDIVLAMRTAAAERVIAAAPAAASWAAAATALLVARERIRDGGELPPGARAGAARVLGPAAEAGTLAALGAALPPDVRWVLDGVADPGELWRAEARWWTHVEQEAVGLAATAVTGTEVLVGAVALLAVDAWRVRAALEVAARGGTGWQVFDAVA